MSKTQAEPLKTLNSVRRKAIQTACNTKQNEIHATMPDKSSASEALEKRTFGSYPGAKEVDLDTATKIC